MGAANEMASMPSYRSRELRFVIEDELTQVYVLLQVEGDCQHTIQGWHHKTYAASKSVQSILIDMAGVDDPVLWPRQAPETH